MTINGNCCQCSPTFSMWLPRLRLGQLLGILTDRTDHPYTTNPVADVGDHELLSAARELLNDFRRRETEQNEREVEYARAG